jgi:hypothetical protein
LLVCNIFSWVEAISLLRGRSLLQYLRTAGHTQVPYKISIKPWQKPIQQFKIHLLTSRYGIIFHRLKPFEALKGCSLIQELSGKAVTFITASHTQVQYKISIIPWKKTQGTIKYLPICRYVIIFNGLKPFQYWKVLA